MNEGVAVKRFEEGFAPFDFHVVPGPAVAQVLDASRSHVVDLVRRTYLDHHAGRTVNPDSYFLRFPDKPKARIIALPAFLDSGPPVAGIKWISSFPRNVESDLPRASAVLVLNDFATGYPVAILEGAGISAARTAASAALAARLLRPDGYRGTTTAIVGAGPIARAVCVYLREVGCAPDKYVVHDVSESSAKALTGFLETDLQQTARFASSLEEALAADTVVFATTAATPYVTQPFRPGQLVLNISLRDIAPEVILGADNIVDDVEHCLKADTSPHLAEQLSGSRSFVTGTLAEVLEHEVVVGGDAPLIFSPFGLGVLDLAVGAFVLRRSISGGTARRVPDFFHLTSRWGPALRSET